MRGRSSLAHVLLAAAPILRGRLRRRAVGAALRLAPGSFDAARAWTDLLLATGDGEPGTQAAVTAVVAESLLHELQRRSPLDESEAGRLLGTVIHLRSAGLVCHGQLLQDAWVLSMTGMQRNAYFVEFGALDGTAHSNTLLLERDFGWTGVLVEPSRKYHERLRGTRRATVDVRCVAGRSNERVQFLECGDLSTMWGYGESDRHRAVRARATEVTEVVTVSLNDLLTEHRAPREPDFLSIDTEGSELDILRAFDFSGHRPRLMCVEHNHTSAEREIDRLLARHGYRRCLPRVSQWDGWYVHADFEVPGGPASRPGPSAATPRR